MEEVGGAIFTFIFIYSIIGVFFGLIAGSLNENKGCSYWTGFWCGFLLGLIGILIVAVQKDKTEVSSYNPTEALEKLQKLKESGAISEQEFKESKEKILSRL